MEKHKTTSVTAEILRSFIAERPVTEAAEYLGIGFASLYRLLSGNRTPRRATVLKNNWKTKLLEMHPATAIGQAIPEQEKQALENWLKEIIGFPHPLLPYIGHMEPPDAAQLLGVSQRFLRDTLTGTTKPLRGTILKNKWKKKLSQAHPAAARRSIPKQEKQALEEWLNEIIGFRHPLLYFIGHLQQKKAARLLGVGEDYMGLVLAGTITPHRKVIIKNNWGEKLRALHPATEAGQPVPAKESKALDNWLNEIVGFRHPLLPYIGHMQQSEAAEQLGTDSRSLRRFLSGKQLPRRSTIIKNNWKTKLPELHPATALGQAIPMGQKIDLQNWLNSIVGANHPLRPFITDIKSKEVAQQLGVSPYYLKQILADKQTPTRIIILKNRWKEKLLALHPAVAAGQDVPERARRNLTAWLDGIIGPRHPLLPFVGHILQEGIAARQLGISYGYLNNILTGKQTPRRAIILKNDWSETLLAMHPATATGQPVPERERRALEAWLNKIIKKHPLIPFIGHLQNDIVAEQLGISPAYVGRILSENLKPSHRIILRNNWKEKLPALHPATVKGNHIPFKDRDALQDWLKECIAVHPLMPFIGHMQQEEAAQRLGVSSEFIGAILAGKHTPSRQTILKNKWGETLPPMHPATMTSNYIPDAERDALNNWLDRCTGYHPLDAFIGHMTQEAAARELGISRAFLNLILCDDVYVPSLELIGLKDWRNKLLQLKPDASPHEIDAFDEWALSLNQKSIYTDKITSEWHEAIATAFVRIRESAGDNLEEFIESWPEKTVRDKTTKENYKRMENVEFKVTSKTATENKQRERKEFIIIAERVCKTACLTGEWANDVAYGKPVTPKQRQAAQAYQNLLALLPEQTPAGRAWLAPG